MNQITMGALLVTLFLGGPNGPAFFFPRAGGSASSGSS